MDLRRIDPGDEEGLAAWHAVLEASDHDLWPALQGYSRRDVTALARFRGSSRRFALVAAGEPAGPIDGVGLLELPQRDNRHAAEITVAVDPARRRRGVGTALVEGLGSMALSEGRRTLNAIVDVPVALAATHASVFFAPRVGFVPTMAGNMRHLHLPPDPARLDELRNVVATARGARDYHTLTFEGPWLRQLVEDKCALLRVMSTDEPSGDEEREEEMWDAARVEEEDELCRARGATTLVALARHAPSGHVVALSELLLSEDAPAQAWQMITVVHPAHRGHRLGLATKLANLDALTRRAPGVRVITTGNAAVNAPMIAVNDLLGFEVVGAGMFWQKQLAP